MDRKARVRWWLRRLTLASAVVTASATAFYATENWLGDRAWQQYKRTLIARGQRFDPGVFNPPPVPDRQNFLKTPLLAAWFPPSNLSPGMAPAVRTIAITRRSDESLLGSWSEAQPTDLTEWRDCFRPIKRTVARAAHEAGTATGNEEIVPLIVIDDVPLADAIRSLARHAGCNFMFDPGAVDVANGGRPMAYFHVSIRFENVTARDALEALLENYGLALVKRADSSIYCLTKALASARVWPDETLDLETARLPPVVDEVVPLVVIDLVPALDAIRNTMRQTEINYQFDPEVLGMPLATNYSLRLTNVTLRELLIRELDDHGLALKDSDHPSLFRVVRSRGPRRSAQYYSAATVLASFANFDTEFQALYAACERPRSQLDVDYRREFSGQPNYASLRTYWQIAHALTLHASAHLALNHSEIAVQDLTVLHRLTDTFRGHPGARSFALRESYSRLYLQIVWEGLASHRWSAAQLKTLEQHLESMDLLAACAAGLEGNQTQLDYWIEQEPQEGQAHTLFLHSMTGYRLLRFGWRGWVQPAERLMQACPHGWIRQSQLAYTESIQAALALIDVPHQRVFPEQDQAVAAWRNRPPTSLATYTYLARKHAPDNRDIVRRSAWQQTGVNLAKVACALERYRLAHGQFPDRLAQAVPDFLAKLPHDLVTGRPLQYRRTDEGQFALYSVGWDRNDDAAGEGDWVWRYPAK